MDILGALLQLVGVAGTIPAVEKVLIVVVAVAVALILLVNALVALWHAIVSVIASVGAILKIFGTDITPLIDKLKVSDQKVADFSQGTLIPILNRISAIPLPKKPQE